MQIAQHGLPYLIMAACKGKAFNIVAAGVPNDEVNQI
jgi:hypothetical protein